MPLSSFFRCCCCSSSSSSSFSLHNEFHSTRKTLTSPADILHFVDSLSVHSQPQSCSLSSLANNFLESSEELQSLQGLQLRELRLEGNPFIKTEGADKTGFHGVIRGFFPTLILLDGNELKPLKIEFNIPVPTSLPPSLGNFWEDRVLEKPISDFINAFFSRYDSSRNSLLQAYVDTALFSVSIPHYKRDPEAARRSTPEKLPTLPPSEAKNYQEVSRNLLDSHDKTSKKLQSKRLAVLATLDKLPPTRVGWSRHDLSSFKADAFILPSVGSNVQMCKLMLTGNFQEQVFSTWKDRRFHRTFILCSPPPADSASAGWQVAICNDQLCIRNAFQDERGTQVQQPMESAPVQPQLPPAPMAQPTPDQISLTNQLLQLCPCPSHELAFQCLQQSNWNLQSAVQNMQNFLG
ncbi:hypothetical protein GUITHDRAFT_137965 [Guillardia theta CCMP2712]|uniref:NTF2 domain-containing protein n=1 Tax=Guillardia theta (strain CCMP2712) TaxID=905079 RepID=L1JET4_GUITC|nr:hypothetical protein GUITHDRAFT_137965 [Guillardia theta CCMP2712]EKX47006.1 hypothetical protein GUITHDRAFT_137965 [Guillardia theta CCMP2712]|eukprot:XP_005833986.1 hypothetical protein GUITHDRAFT_137965 [Guillardia theta CCMP2712]